MDSRHNVYMDPTGMALFGGRTARRPLDLFSRQIVGHREF